MNITGVNIHRKKGMRNKGLRGEIKGTVLCILLFFFIISLTVNAEEISLEEAISSGLESNYEIEEKYQVMKNLERERAILETGIDWTWGLKSSYGYNSDGYTTGSYLEGGDNLGFTIDGGKITLNGLGINTQFSLTDYEPFAFSDLDKKYHFRLDLSKRLYPLLPTETEKSLIQIDNRINIAKRDLFSARNNKVVDWLETYFNLLRLEEKLTYSQINYELALENLKKIEIQSEIAEAGKGQLLVATIGVKEAELQEKQLENSFIQARDTFILETGINGKITLTDDDYLKSFVKKVDSINVEIGEEEIEQLLKDNSLQLKQIIFNKEYAEKELKWQLEENKVKVDTFGNYNYDASLADKDYWELGVGITYDFYDSGEQKLAIEGIEAKIESLEKEYDYTLERLKQELEAMYLQYDLNKMALETEEIGLEKARLEEILYKEQYDSGLITENQYKEMALALKQAELDYKETLDILRFNKARIALYLGIY